MKLLYLPLIAAATLFAQACGTSKKAATSTAPAGTPAPAAATTAKPANGVFDPGPAELRALQATDKSATLDQLHEGYTLYTGTCTKCHGAKSIYSRPTEAWPNIIDKMAPRSNLSSKQKDAVLKYVLAIKATQEK
jgi:mono/diheme cytochrome c family protein